MRKIGCVSFVVFLVLGAVATTVAQPPSYEFRLRGGGFGSGQILTIRGSNPALMRLVVKFRPGNMPAGQGLKPGEGSWLDRGMRPNEPFRIEGDVPEMLAAQVAISLGQDPKAYWRFWIYNTNKGYFQITGPPAPYGNTKVPEVVRFDNNQ
jgi:hypothetical protein